VNPASFQENVCSDKMMHFDEIVPAAAVSKSPIQQLVLVM
jgi:hypothetical protein